MSTTWRSPARVQIIRQASEPIARALAHDVESRDRNSMAFRSDRAGFFPHHLDGEGANLPPPASRGKVAGYRSAPKSLAAPRPANRQLLRESVRKTSIILGLIVLAIITKRAALLFQESRSFVSTEPIFCLLSWNGFSSRRARLRLHDIELCAAARPVLYCWNHSLIIYVGDFRAPDSCRPLEWSVMRVNFL
jgi:hypothetical protein